MHTSETASSSTAYHHIEYDLNQDSQPAKIMVALRIMQFFYDLYLHLAQDTDDI